MELGYVGLSKIHEESVLNEIVSGAIQSHFEDLPDPRINRWKAHLLMDIMVLSICAVISGADGWTDVEEYGKAKFDWLKTFLELPNGIPSHDTFGRVFARLSPKAFQECFLNWIHAVYEITDSQVIAIDGKTLRRSHNRAADQGPIQMVSAWASANELVLGQVKTDAKSNEITAIPELLWVLELHGCYYRCRWLSKGGCGSNS